MLDTKSGISDALREAFNLAPGYHSACWVERSDTGFTTDRAIPEPLKAFLAAACRKAHEVGISESVGAAYMRIIDGNEPENYLLWHTDNADGGVRFTTTIASDDAPVQLGWLLDDYSDLVGESVERSLPWLNAQQPRGYRQPPNGEVVMFTTQPHGVLPQRPRPGERTAVFFMTLYRSRREADLFTTNCTKVGEVVEHHELPQLESTR